MCSKEWTIVTFFSTVQIRVATATVFLNALIITETQVMARAVFVSRRVRLFWVAMPSTSNSTYTPDKFDRWMISLTTALTDAEVAAN
jgi:hypothetical protein